MTEGVKKRKIPSYVRIFVGLILGIIVGLILNKMGGEDIPFIAEKVIPFMQFLGDFFIKAIKMVLVPLVFFSILNAAISLGDINALKSIGLKTILWFLLSSAFAAGVGLVFVNIIKPGIGITLGSAENAMATEATLPGPYEIILGLIPSNPVKSLADGDMMPIIVFALILGFAIIYLEESRTKELINIISVITDAMLTMIGWIVKIIPFGVFGLMGVTMTKFGTAIFGPVFKFIITDYISALTVTLVFYPIVLIVLGKVKPLPFFKKAFEPWLIAFSTCTSSAALPVSMRVAPEKLGVEDKVSNFVLPFGATANMNGTNIYFACIVVFAAQLYGIELSIGQQIFIVLQGTLLSVGCAATPQIGLIISISLLTQMGLPLEATALVAGIYRIIDQIHTATNSLGDLVTSVIIARSENKLNTDDYYNMSL